MEIREKVLKLLPNRLVQQYPINDPLTFHDAKNNLIWVVTQSIVPDEEINDESNIRSFNKKSVVKFLGKLYKPIIWENIGIAFVTFDEYNVHMRAHPVPRLDETEESRDYSDEEDIDFLTLALSKIRSAPPVSTSSPSRNELTFDKIFTLRQPPPAFFKPGKKREKEQLEINKWARYIENEGFSLEEYKKVYREYRRVNKSSPFVRN